MTKSFEDALGFLFFIFVSYLQFKDMYIIASSIDISSAYNRE
jgi:hypothetical protein